jgi:sarcosine oxidase gamma subunit
MSFDQWNLIFKKDIEQKKFYKLCNTFNKSTSILATNLTDSQIFFQVGGENATMILNKLTHFDFREKSFKPLTAAQTLLARIDCSIFNLDKVILLSCGRSFSDYLEDRLIDAVNL